MSTINYSENTSLMCTLAYLVYWQRQRCGRCDMADKNYFSFRCHTLPKLICNLFCRCDRHCYRLSLIFGTSFATNKFPSKITGSILLVRGKDLIAWIQRQRTSNYIYSMSGIWNVYKIVCGC